MEFSDLVTILGAGHLFSEHSGMDGKGLRKVGPIQYAAHWLYGVSEPAILRAVDRLFSSRALTGTRAGRMVLRLIAWASRYLPHGVVVTTPAAERLVDFIVHTEGPRGARLAVGPCVCQRALNRWKEPCNKDMVLLYGADIYYHLNVGYKLLSPEEAKGILRECHAAGLIHAIEFCMQSGKWIFVVCNCDGEICVPTRGYFLTGRFLFPGPEIVAYDPARCVGEEQCGRCLDRCMFGANLVVDGKISLDAGRCLGCGLCVSTCAGKARSMRERGDYGRDRQVPAEILLGRTASAGSA